MEKIKKRLDVLVTILLVVCILVSGILIFQLIRGEKPSLFGYRIMHIVTGSMEPTLEVGGNVVIKEVDPHTLKIGDIITFQSKDAQIYGQANTHRIAEIQQGEDGKIYFVTKGDANPREDILHVYASDIYGKVVFYTNASKWFTLFFEFLHTRMGFVTVVILPLMLATYFYVRDFVKQVNEAIKDQALKELEEERLEQQETEQKLATEAQQTTEQEATEGAAE